MLKVGLKVEAVGNGLWEEGLGKGENEESCIWKRGRGIAPIKAVPMRGGVLELTRERGEAEI